MPEERIPRRVRPLCGHCKQPLFFAAKSHKHYTHKNGRGACEFTKVMGSQIEMETLQWR
jgi:hypothetical protein